MVEETVEIATESDVEIEVVDDTPEEDRISPKDKVASEDFDIPEDEIGQYSDRVQKRIKRLKYEFHEQRRAKEVAERQNKEALTHAQRVISENRNLKNLLQKGNDALYKATEAKTDSEMQMAEKEFREAYDAGDTDRIVEAQKKVNDAQYSKRSVEDLRPPQGAQANAPQVQQQQQQQYTPPPDPRAIEWLRDNPWFGKDKEMTSFAYGLHDKLVVDQKIDPRSEDYYQAVDKRMRTVFPDHFSEDTERNAEEVFPKGEVSRRTVVAPATRAVKSPRKVTLSSTQVDLAKKLGLTTEQYANQVAKDTAHGR
tara:strand:- start:208 stop:1140 length:933 start_codon:yes stop_codon:yes gene_type:complete